MSIEPRFSVFSAMTQKHSRTNKWLRNSKSFLQRGTGSSEPFEIPKEAAKMQYRVTFSVQLVS